MILFMSDIALIELEDPWTFDEQTRIKPACLMGFERDRFEDTFLGAGYGRKSKRFASFTKLNLQIRYLGLFTVGTVMSQI